jgi:hypothetical protein
MYWKNKVIGFLILTVGLTSCFEDDIAVDPVERIHSSMEIDAGEVKKDVNFISLDQGRVLQKVDPMIWDLTYEGGVLTMNGFKSMEAAQILGSWADIKDTNGLKFDYISTDYNGKIWELKANQMYVLNMGLDKEFETIGFMKFRFTADGSVVKLQFSDLEAETFKEVTLMEERFHYSINGDSTAILPFPSEYDFALGRYTDFVIFPDEQAFYKVYGAILGNARAKQYNKAFEEITSEYRDSILDASNSQKSIGWDWKSYTIQQGLYKVYEDNTYLIESNSGFVYKLRFIDFYNSKGVSGHPTFEYALL